MGKQAVGRDIKKSSGPPRNQILNYIGVIEFDETADDEDDED